MELHFTKRGMTCGEGPALFYGVITIKCFFVLPNKKTALHMPVKRFMKFD